MPVQDKTAAAIETLTSLSSNHESQSEFYSDISALIQSKLYHQLTVNILEFTSDPSNSNTASNNFEQLYDILSNVKSKLNPLMLSRIASNVSTTTNQTSILTALLTTEEIKAAPHAKLYTESKLNLLLLHQQTTSPSSDFLTEQSLQISQFLKDNTVKLQELASSTESEIASVHSSFYETAMEYYKMVGPAHSFYKNAIQYLHYTPLQSLSAEQCAFLARDLSLAALVGEGVYNLGEIVYENQLLLDALEGSEEEYLVELMRGAAEGRILSLDKYQEKLQGHGCDVRVISEKIMLLALIHMVFEKEAGDRILKFDDISKRLSVEGDQVEWVVMKALSLGLIKGSMDQVEGVVEVSWVMPRVLDQGGLKSLSERFGEWADKVKDTKGYMLEHVPAF
jgi:26S proteasome regulatory subunit N9